jgi:gliding motility associated protien GldN
MTYCLSIVNKKNKIMHNKIIKIVLLGLLVIVFSINAEAQQRSKKKRSFTSTVKKKTKSKSLSKNERAIDTVAPAIVGWNNLQMPIAKASNENDNGVQRLLVKDRTPLAYEHLREDDVMYKQRVWRVIDTREQMNAPFRYDAEEDNGSQLLINILLTGIQKKELQVYNPIDDRFTTPLNDEDLITTMVGKPYYGRIPHWEKDSTGTLMKDTLIVDMFNPALITKYQVKEEWIFDKESSRMFVRILGIAPLMDVMDPLTGMLRGEKKLFWIYYPKARTLLSNAEAYNAKNHGARPSWEEVFESRMFSSYIVKSTMNNPDNKVLEQMPGLKDNGILRLWEGENIKNKLLNYEQNLWSY